MDVGTGIFLGMSSLGLIALYIVTRDRWRWRKIVIRSGLGCVALLLAAWAGLAVKGAYDNRVMPVQTYQGLKLTDTRADVRFKKGEPTEVNDRVWGFAKDDQTWQTIVLFSGDKIRAIFYAGTCTDCDTLNGLNIGSSYDSVIERLGQPTKVSATQDGLSRYLSFNESNMVVRVARGQVDALGIYNPAVGPPEFGQK